MRAARLLAICIAVVVMTVSSAAWAQDNPKPVDLEDDAEDRPWAKGVSVKSQQAARQIFYKANDLLVNQFFKQAADRYREVLTHWDHPAVHYNLSLALMNLEQPVELYRALGKALEHGVPPLVTEANYERAEKYRQLLEQQLSHIEIVCSEQGANVTMDGKLLFKAPGSYKTTVLAGEHTIAATKDGFIADNRSVVLAPGKKQTFKLKLFTLADFTDQYRRYPKWLPWTVTGAGAFVLATGGFLHTRSRSGFQTFDADFDTTCDQGCLDDDVPDLAGRLSGATWQQRAAWGMYVIGGAALTTGLVLVFLNQPKTIRRETPNSEAYTFTPVVGPDLTGISASFRF